VLFPFERTNLVEPSHVTWLPAESRAEKSGGQVARERFPDHTRTNHEQIHVVVLDALTRGIAIVADSRAHSVKLVGGDGRPHPASTYQNPAFGVAAGHRPSGHFGEIGIIIRRVVGVRSQIDDQVSPRLDLEFKELLQIEPGVIGGKCNAHETNFELWHDTISKELLAMIKPAQFESRYRVTDGKKFRLKNVDPGDTWKLKTKERAKDLLSEGVTQLTDLQEKLYAQNTWAVLLILQAMDAAGKDSTIKHVMSGVNPQGCSVSAFKAPSPRELDHDFLWRSTLVLPERGRIGIFNRSYYEEVLVVRVHPELLVDQKIPAKLVSKRIWEERFDDINASERHLHRSGVVVRKFFLHVSKAEQKRRFLERIENKRKNWKFAIGDLRERERWDDYMDAYEEMVQRTATDNAPWYVVPADNKWFTRLVVSAVIVETLQSLDLKFPRITPEKKKELVAGRASLTVSNA
jgi:PPK2 family polyphosphate:nucleotide phosphotransferase